MLRFTKTYTTNSNAITFDYVQTKALSELASRKIVTYDDYIQWVRDYKDIINSLSKVIQDLRTIKNKWKASEDTNRIWYMNSAYSTKQALGWNASRLNSKRIENKALLKKGKFARVEITETA